MGSRFVGFAQASSDEGCAPAVSASRPYF